MFSNIKKAVAERLTLLANNQLFQVELEYNQLFEAYLDCFIDPAERQSHNCNCCKNFLRNYGGIISIVDGKVQTLWDFELTDELYKEVPKVLDNIIREAAISSVFLSHTKVLGTDFNYQVLEGLPTIKWEHFSAELSGSSLLSTSYSIATVAGDNLSTKQVFQRSLEEITLDSIETVLELIAQNSLYRGEEHKQTVINFLTHKKAYLKLTSGRDKELYAWSNFKSGGRIRNTVIGTLLSDLSEGKELDYAVRSFEQKVAPSNYKRPTALVTKGMIEQAEKTIKELGLEQSLARRYAVSSDIPITDVLFVNRDIKVEKSLFDSLKEDVAVNPRTFSKVEEVNIDTFINDIVPTATSLEVLLENKHSNFMSLLAPVDNEAPLLFNWDNGISWSYQDGLADSMKDRVKAAGGKVEGALRFSIQWNDDGNNNIDFDAHAIEPDGYEIYFSNKGSKSRLSGMLDVDIISPQGKVAVENIIWERTPYGITHLFVHNYSSCMSRGGFTTEIEYEGQVYSYTYGKNLRGGEKVTVAKINITENGLEFLESLDNTTASISKKVWELSTNTFHKVSMLLLSPNYWNGKHYGNKHTFFILDKAINPDRPRGIFNEFLKPELQEHRKVFEVLGSKLKVEESDQQLSGLGFSSTQRAEVFVRVTGTFTRVIKVKF